MTPDPLLLQRQDRIILTLRGGAGIGSPIEAWVDAFRTSHVQRSDGWIETTWNNMSAPSTGTGVVTFLMG